MASIRYLLLVLYSWSSLTISATPPDPSIAFRDISIEEALTIAKKEGKYVFIDTYAEWCLPCKQMEVVFVDEDVATFFNTNFVNVRINMDEPIGKKVSQDYDIVFLPTLIMLDADGNVKNKIDKLVTGEELINHAIEGMKNNAIYHDNLNSNPFVKKEEPKEKRLDSTDEELRTIITEDDAPVVYVHDERASSGRPHIMYHEAYLHLQLMDGKAQTVAKKYLSTQDDWSTDKNIRFIFDFLYDVRSPEFEYFAKHRSDFVRVVGDNNVSITLDILVNLQMEKGYPRPTYQEALDLFALIDPSTAEAKADQYWVSRKEN